MTRSFVDAADWVMVPNVIGMGLWADGGRMATKPYAAGGNYIDTMSDYCGDCRFDRKQRVGDDACPFTTLYWDFLARHRDKLGGVRRMAMQLKNLDRKPKDELDAVRQQAAQVRASLAPEG